MTKLRYFFLLFLALLFFPLLLKGDGVDYVVEIKGIEDPALVKTIRRVSSLIRLKNRLPNSASSLHFRVESDLPDIKRVLHSYGYYESTIDVRYNERKGKIYVEMTIFPGPVYTVGKFSIELTTEGSENGTLMKELPAQDDTVKVGAPARSIPLITAELKLLEWLANEGYPLAKVARRNVIANGKSKEVEVSLLIETGSVATFGSLFLKGLVVTEPQFIVGKLKWCSGDLYRTCLVRQAQDELIKTGLFSSALITHDDKAEADGALPLVIEVTESKHHSVNVGVSYQTFFGPGVTFGWEHRNMGGMGRRLSIQGDLTKKSHSGTALLFLPDFCARRQNYIWQAQALHEAITAYSQRTYNILTRLERQFGSCFSSSIGLKLERLYVTGSVKNGRFLLFETPIYARWSTANSLLNPTCGHTFDVHVVPSMNIDDMNSYFLLQEVRLSHYLPLTTSHNWVLAQKVTLGSIISSRLGVVPVSKRFLGGSEEELRGYKYKTVSKLTKKDKPIGGRSAVYYSLEMRLRATDSLGFVPFFDIGNVYSTQFPTFDKKWVKSVGLGVRYFSLIGPIRFDVGFPLDRRKGIDPKYRVLVSIGQAF